MEMAMSGHGKRLFDRWQRRRATLLDNVLQLTRQSRKEGTEEQVHRLRVTLRRLRLAIRAGRVALDARAAKRFRRWARSVAAGTSAVRDLDVVGEWLRQAGATDEQIEFIEGERARIWGATRANLKRLPNGAREGLARNKQDRQTRRRFQLRWTRLGAKVRERVRLDLFRFDSLDAEARHEFRRNVRRWRYLREIEIPRIRLKTDPLLQRLEGVQEATGNQQNLALVAQVFAAGGPPLAAGQLRRLRRAEEEADRAIPGAFASLVEWEGWDDTRFAKPTVVVGDCE